MLLSTCIKGYGRWAGVCKATTCIKGYGRWAGVCKATSYFDIQSLQFFFQFGFTS